MIIDFRKIESGKLFGNQIEEGGRDVGAREVEMREKAREQIDRELIQVVFKVGEVVKRRKWLEEQKAEHNREEKDMVRVR